MIATSLVLLALVAGSPGRPGADRARQSAKAERSAKLDAGQEELAEANERKAWPQRGGKDSQRANAERLAQIEKGNEIITSIFTDLDIRQDQGRARTLEAVLAKRLVKAAEQLEGEAIGDPLVVAELQDRSGRSLLSLGMDGPRRSICSRRLRDTNAAPLGADNADTLITMSGLATVYQDVGKLAWPYRFSNETLKGERRPTGRTTATPSRA